MTNAMKALEFFHSSANNPSEPYQGVNALFNADLHRVSPNWAPRKDWVMVSPYIIELATRESTKND
jgi:hypothetical protein